MITSIPGGVVVDFRVHILVGPVGSYIQVMMYPSDPCGKPISEVETSRSMDLPGHQGQSTQAQAGASSLMRAELSRPEDSMFYYDEEEEDNGEEQLNTIDQYDHDLSHYRRMLADRNVARPTVATGSNVLGTDSRGVTPRVRFSDIHDVQSPSGAEYRVQQHHTPARGSRGLPLDLRDFNLTSRQEEQAGSSYPSLDT